MCAESSGAIPGGVSFMSADDTWIGGKFYSVNIFADGFRGPGKGHAKCRQSALAGIFAREPPTHGHGFGFSMGMFNFMYCSRTLELSPASGFYLCYFSAMCKDASIGAGHTAFSTMSGCWQVHIPPIRSLVRRGTNLAMSESENPKPL